MKNLLILIVILVLIIASCRKVATDPERITGSYYPYKQVLPYDTANLSGVFITQRNFAQDLPLFSAWFNNKPGAQYNDVSTQVYENNYRLGFFNDVKQFLPYLGYQVYYDNLTTWLIKSDTSFSFTYADTAIQPYALVNMPDTISTANKFAFIFSRTDVDTITVSVGNIVNYFSPLTDSVQLSSLVFGDLTGYRVNVAIAFYTHHYFTTNGYTYLFVKEYNYSRYVVR